MMSHDASSCLTSDLCLRILHLRQNTYRKSHVKLPATTHTYSDRHKQSHTLTDTHTRNMPSIQHDNMKQATLQYRNGDYTNALHSLHSIQDSTLNHTQSNNNTTHSNYTHSNHRIQLNELVANYYNNSLDKSKVATRLLKDIDHVLAMNTTHGKCALD